MRVNLGRYFPYPHFMGLAPLDVWIRLLRASRGAIPARYWPRLGFALALSALATAATLPERLALPIWLRLRRPRRTGPPVFILGYYRSGTTHLQHLLSQDPRLFSPTWTHVLAPQGFIVTWTFLRFFLIPFAPVTRLVDAMAFDPDAVSEDEFALNNWAVASPLAGRAVVPQLHAFYDRFHDLQRLDPAELSRWRRYHTSFTSKLLSIAGDRRLLLKSPSHTARVAPLLQLFPGAKFIHLARDPLKVARSNLALLQTMQRRYGLQDPVPESAMERHVVREYVATEGQYLAARGAIPKGDLAELRFEDLMVAPVSEIKRIYRELSLPYTDAFDRRLHACLARAQGYVPNVHPPLGKEREDRLATELAPLIERFHQGGPRPPADPRDLLEDRRHPIRAALVAPVSALVCLVLWLIAAHLTQNRHDWLIWPTGVAIGYVVWRTAGSGSAGLGFWSLSLSVLALLAAALANSFTVDHAGQSGVPWHALWAAARRQLTNEAELFWSFMGLASAYRLASRRR